jgi:PhnB protein
MAHQTLQPYLFFGGRCEEAIAFYQAAIGARQEFLMRYEESPEPMPPGMLAPGFEQKVMHASIRIGEQVVMASDGCHPGAQFQGFSLALTLPTPDAARLAFDALAAGGAVTMPLAPTFWSPMYGMLTDRFGVCWMVMAEMQQAAAPAAR